MRISISELKENNFEDVINLVTKLSEYKPAKSKYKTIWKHYYNQKNSFSVVATCKKKIVGFGFICFNMTIRGGKIAYIEDIICESSYRGRGIGKAIMNKLYKFAKKNKCYKVVLQCNNSNVDFYKKCGYLPNGVTMQKIIM